MYNPYFQPVYQPPVNQYQQPQGILTVSSEDEALKYPIAPGNSIMFKIENQPLIIEKTMGLSQLDTPLINYIDLVPRANRPEYATKSDLDQLREEIKSWQDKLTEKRTARKKVEENE